MKYLCRFVLQFATKYMLRFTDYDVIIGVDTGKHTGLAICVSENGKRNMQLLTRPIHSALAIVTDTARRYNKVLVRFEDARQRKWFGSNAYAKQQGAGSVKRDAVIWEDFLTDLKKECAHQGRTLDFEAVAPKDNLTKISPLYFKMLTGHETKASEHARDAAGLVIRTGVL